MWKSKMLIVMLLLFISLGCSAERDPKSVVANKLLNDYKSIINLMKTEPTTYNLIRALDKANGLLGVYRDYLKNEDLVWVQKNYEALKNTLGSFSTIYFGYSKSGLHIIALAQPLMSHNFNYKEVANKIRGDNKETDFLSEIYLKPRYYAIDLFVENLLGKPRNLNLDITVSEGDESQKPIFDEKVKEDIKDILDKYHREYSPSKTISTGEWKLYIFKKDMGWPQIVIRCDNEIVKLVNK